MNVYVFTIDGAEQVKVTAASMFEARLEFDRLKTKVREGTHKVDVIVKGRVVKQREDENSYGV